MWSMSLASDGIDLLASRSTVGVSVEKSYLLLRKVGHEDTLPFSLPSSLYIRKESQKAPDILPSICIL